MLSTYLIKIIQIQQTIIYGDGGKNGYEQFKLKLSIHSLSSHGIYQILPYVKADCEFGTRRSMQEITHNSIPVFNYMRVSLLLVD